MDLISPNYLYNNHKLYTDNYYTSLKLATNMIKNNKFNRNYKEEYTKINIGESIKLDGIVVCRFEI